MSKAKKAAVNPGKTQEDFEEEWNKLAQAFQKSLQCVIEGCKKPPDHIVSQMGAYSICYNLCTSHDATKAPSAAGHSNTAQVIYHRAKRMIEDYLTEIVTNEVTHKKGEELLRQIHKHWENHQIVVKWCKIMFNYLDQFYTKSQMVDNLRVMMMKCFNTAVFERVKGDLCVVLLAEITKEREGVEINRGVMKTAIELFMEMGMECRAVYERDFEAPLLEATRAFYSRAASAWMSEPGGNRTYLKRVEKCLAEEDSRANSYLHTSSRQPVIGVVEAELLSRYQMAILEDVDSGAEALLESWKTEELQRMYRLFKRVNKGLDQMAAILRDFIKRQGKVANKKFCDGELDGNAYIDACLDLHDQYSALFKTYFEDSTIFYKSRREGFEVFINESLVATKKENATKTSISELLSTYCDNLMKNEKMTPTDLDERHEKVVALFAYISDKDLFQEYYRKQMSKRLLVSKTDNDNEKQFLSKLKLKMGAPYTSKLEGMIVDKGQSAETQKNFIAYCQKKNILLQLDFSVQVLTTGYWPAYKSEPVNLPTELQYHIDLFKKFYDQTTQSRVLRWIHSLGTATVASRFRSGPKEISMSTYQACVLCLLNTREEIAVQVITVELGLPLDEVKPVLHSLAFGKFPVLKKAGDVKSKTITEADVFQVNEDFSSPQRKFKIPVAVRAVGESVERVTDDNRKHVVEACIVRTMKSRKQLHNTELQSEVLRQLGTFFKPDPRMIKKRIEDLIERGYLERDEGDRNTYRYLA
eukprot:RCo006541